MDGGIQHTAENYARLHSASLQKFLAYAIIGAATFVGYVQLSIAYHDWVGHPLIEILLIIVLLSLAVAVILASTAAARQYFLFSRLEASDQLRLRGLETELVKEAPPLIVNLTFFAHGFGWSAMKQKVLNALTALTLAVVVLLMLVFVIAIAS